MADGRVIRAKRAVISDAGLVNTFRHLLPEPSKTINKGKLIKKYLEQDDSCRLREGSSGLNLFVGLKGDFDSDLNLPQGQLWVVPDSSVEEYLYELGKISLDEAIKTL